MSDIINDIDDDVELKNSNLGKKAIFVNSLNPDESFSFSSTIENIGINHDRQLKNYTEVLIISDEQEAHHPIVGKISVTKVIADQDVWLPTNSIVILDEPTESRLN